MANTPQAKKRIRRNTARTVVNKNRVSRIRTLVKKVENAVAAGDKDAAATALKAAQPENGARRCQGRASQEHRGAQVLAPDQERERDRLIRLIPKREQKGPAGFVPAGPFLRPILLHGDGNSVAAR